MKVDLVRVWQRQVVLELSNVVQLVKGEVLEAAVANLY